MDSVTKFVADNLSGEAVLHIDRITEEVEYLPVWARSMYLNGISGKSRKSAIRAHCVQCVGGQRDEIQCCTSYECALYAYRMRG